MAQARLAELPSLSRKAAVGLAVIFLLLSIPVGTHFVRYGGLASFHGAASLLVLAAASLTWPRLLRTNDEEVRTAKSTAGGATLVFLGYGTNLLVVQSMALIVMFISALTGEIDQAWWAAVVAVGVAVILDGTERRLLSIMLGTAGALYIVYLWFVRDLMYEIESSQLARATPQLIVPVGAILWTMAVLAAFPQLQVMRLGRLGLGRLRGDTHVNLMGSRVPIFFTSALLLCCAWVTAQILFSAPKWLINMS
jgi:hypothetical protein